MAIKMNAIKCPECGANLPIEEGRTQIFCSYCGTKIIITNENEYIFRNIDEAEIKQAETERILELRRLEIAEKERLREHRFKAVKIGITIFLGLLTLICFAVGYSDISLDSLSFLMVGLISGSIALIMWPNN